jgi:hypothetical protein
MEMILKSLSFLVEKGAIVHELFTPGKNRFTRQ